MASPSRILAIAAVLVLVPDGAAQERPLERTFTAGATSSYRITLRVRLEVEGQQSTQIGAKNYVKAFSRWAEGQITWRANCRIVSVGSDGAAEVLEMLDDFDSVQSGSTEDDKDAEKLARALAEELGRWAAPRPHELRYREARNGQLTGLAANGVPAFDEAAPRVTSLWLLRALRPTVALPDAPLRLHEAWQQLRSVQLANWSEVRGSESGEWLEASASAEPAARLHIVQQIRAVIAAGPEKPPEGAGQARFHAETLNTVSLSDGRLLAAVRSATREITWTLTAVEGLPERPEFRARLSVEVQIEPLR